MAKRKTSTLPSRVYKYALRPPTTNADLVDETFREARRYYNKLVTIENVRRARYRQARARLFPDFELLEKQIDEIGKKLTAAREQIKASKAAERSRAVSPADHDAVKDLKAELSTLSQKLKEERARIASSPIMKTDSNAANQEAALAVKALRHTMYWGTYQLCEAAIQQASKKSKFEVAYDETPAHLLKNRIGVQFIGGLTPADLATDTQIQIVNPPEHRQTERGKWRPRYQHDADGKVIYCMLKFRIASTDKRKPIWAEFPLAYDRPVPADARIMQACITRRPLRERNPWQYHLCITLESREFERTLPHPDQVSKTAINFGWRQLEDGSLRVATVNRDGQTPTHVELPARFMRGIAHCRKLQSLLDEKFEATKTTLFQWIAAQSSLPEAFVSSFEHLVLWKSQHRLCEIIRYWRDHRISGDAEIWPVVSQWHERYLHLHDWMTNQRRHLMRWRDDFYRCTAKELATTSAEIEMDTFKIADVARRPQAEVVEEGGELARRNRVLAAPSELRNEIRKACAKHHCPILAAPTVNGTRRCNVCGETYVWDPARKIDHTCPGIACGATWDQDVNNTDNLHDARASGNVVPLVVPAKKTESGQFQSSETTPFGTARRALGK